MEIPLRYRRDPRDEDFESAEEEYAMLRDIVQQTMLETTPEVALDSLLMLTNIFEHRAQMSPNGSISLWYLAMSQMLRQLLFTATHLSPAAPLPNVSFEDQTLYWDTPTRTH